MTTTSPVQTGRKYRRLVYGVFTVGIASLFVGMYIDQSLVGLVVYTLAAVVGVGTTLYLQYDDAVALQDEREAELGRRASNITFQLFGYLGLFGFIALFLLDATGRRPLAGSEVALLYAYAVITLSWGAIYGILRFRS